MLGRSGFRVLAIVFLALSAGAVAAQQAQPTPRPAQQAQPTAQPTQQTHTNAQSNQASEQPYLGVRLEDSTDGVVVREVIAGSPAATAGVQPYDIIKKINDRAVANVSAFGTAIHALHPNAQITLDITRAGSDMTVTATLGTMPTQAVAVLPANQPFDAFGYMSSDKSWQVFSLADTSPLYTAGLREGDTITKFNDTAYDPAGLRTFKDGLANDATVKITVQRNGSPTDVNVPAADFKALRLFGYEDQGLIFNMPAQNGSTPAVAALPTQEPFDSFGYMSADKSWQVFALAEDSALYQAGLRVGDRITKFNETAYDPAGLRTFRAGLADDADVTIAVARGSQTMNFTVPAADLNILDLLGYESSGMLFGVPMSSAHVWLGADILPLNQTVAQQHHLTVNQGALVQAVMPDSPAASAGLQPNDIITGVGSDQVDAQHTLPSLLTSHQPGDQITLNVMRGSQTMHIDATLAQPEISGELPSLIGAF